jgi:hypothetical protein
MDLKDATLMFLTESAGHPAVTSIARSAYDRLAAGEHVDYQVLSDLISEASGKGVLRDMRRKHGPVAFEAIVTPILDEVGRRAPVRSARPPAPAQGSHDDPLTASVWPPR